MSRASPSQPRKERWAMPGRRFVGCSLSVTSAMSRRTPATRSVRSAATRAAVSARRSAVIEVATARPAAPGTSTVPERTSRSCPPPCSSGTQPTSRRSSNAPAPGGPPSLWPVIVIAARPDAAKSTPTPLTACTASLCSGTPNSRGDLGKLRDRLHRPDLVVRPHDADEGDRIGIRGDGVAQRGRCDAARCSSTGRVTTSAPSCSASQSAASSTAWCSTALTITRRRRASWAARRAQ